MSHGEFSSHHGFKFQSHGRLGFGDPPCQISRNYWREAPSFVITTPRNLGLCVCIYIYIHIHDLYDINESVHLNLRECDDFPLTGQFHKGRCVHFDSPSGTNRMVIFSTNMYRPCHGCMSESHVPQTPLHALSSLSPLPFSGKTLYKYNQIYHGIPWYPLVN